MEKKTLEERKWPTSTVVIILASFFSAILHVEVLASAVERFQTLITGFMALGAALWTIKQMQWTDKEAENRHRQSLRATTLNEREAVMAAVTRVEEASRLSEHACKVCDDFKSRPVSLYLEFPERTGRLINLMTAIENELVNADVRNVESLFGSSLLHQLNEVRSSLRTGRGGDMLSDEDRFMSALTAVEASGADIKAFQLRLIAWKDANIIAMGGEIPDIY